MTKHFAIARIARSLALPLALATAALPACSSGGGQAVEDNVPDARELVAERLDAAEPEIPALFAAQVGDPGSDVSLRAVAEASLRVGQRHDRNAELLPTIYDANGWQPVFVVDGALTDSGAAVMQALTDSWAHALFPTDYHVADALALAQGMVEAQGSIPAETDLALTEAEREALVSTLAAEHGVGTQAQSAFRATLIEALFPSDGSPPAVPRLATLRDRAIDAHHAVAQLSAELEVLLANGFLSYAVDVRWFNPVWMDEDVRESESLAEAARRDILLGLFRQGRELGFAQVLAELPPPYEQYGRLVEAHRRYRAMAAEGEWPEVSDARLRRGREDDMVPVLRQRLAREGYFHGDLTSRVYDDELRDALIAYQITHQYSDDGELSESLVSSLNVQPLDRARQIAVTLQRWRESEIGADQTYVLANISDFHAELWYEGRRDMRFRTIVGNTDRSRAGTFLRRTPEIHEDMRYIVFNPYWNVPRGIMESEYDPHLAEDPMWYENNGYEVMYNENGSRWVRQLPGPANALGDVKFLFPNEHDVYMHDTPSRRLFQRTFRAFSHGCVRVENPLDFAARLVELDRGWTRQRMDQFRASGAEEWLTLRDPIPVHIEYYVVRVDDDGHANFLADLYREDQPLLEARAEAEAGDPAWVRGFAVAQVGHEAAPRSEREHVALE
jgi:murein L,D-transpeptidase YcbB/YkuD